MDMFEGKNLSPKAFMSLNKNESFVDRDKDASDIYDLITILLLVF